MKRKHLRAWARLNRNAFAIFYTTAFVAFYLACIANHTRIPTP